MKATREETERATSREQKWGKRDKTKRMNKETKKNP